MDRLWAREQPVTVRDVLDDLNADPDRARPLAYTTVMTVMDNLHRKGMLVREASGRAYRYTAAQGRDEHAAELIAAVLRDSEDRTAPLLRFAEQLTAAERRRLRAALDAAAEPRRTPRSGGRRRGPGGG
jgi:predicted transcriptional regulator